MILSRVEFRPYINLCASIEDSLIGPVAIDYIVALAV